MDPPLINDSTFSSANPTLSEIWPIHSPSHHTNTNTNNNKRHNLPSLSDDSASNKHIKLGTSSHSEDENGASKGEGEAEATSVAGNKLPEQSPKQDYIHVRARRGQATDSHSLAERARREKISERMKILQDIVPGCNKVIGKALVLDEIINYIHSLQRQVEFLSMKLEAVNSRFNISPTVECFPSKEPFDLAGILFGSQPARAYAQGSQPGWLHMQIAGGFEKET